MLFTLAQHLVWVSTSSPIPCKGAPVFGTGKGSGTAKPSKMTAGSSYSWWAEGWFLKGGWSGYQTATTFHRHKEAKCPSETADLLATADLQLQPHLSRVLSTIGSAQSPLCAVITPDPGCCLPRPGCSWTQQLLHGADPAWGTAKPPGEPVLPSGGQKTDHQQKMARNSSSRALTSRF